MLAGRMKRWPAISTKRSDMVTRTEDTSAGRNVQYVERLVDFVDRFESAVRSGDLPQAGCPGLRFARILLNPSNSIAGTTSPGCARR